MLPTGELTPITKHCVEVIGDALGLDWTSFNESPHAFTEATTPAEIVIGGMILVIGTNGIPISEATSDDAPPTLSTHLNKIIEQQHWQTQMDSGQMYFELIQSSIKTIKYDPSIPFWMAYQNETIFIGDITYATLSENADDTGAHTIGNPNPSISIFEAGHIVIHETTHAFYGRHIPCTGDGNSCDETLDGAYGAEAWWGALWLQQNYTNLSYNICFREEATIYETCRHINNVRDYQACLLQLHCETLI